MAVKIRTLRNTKVIAKKFIKEIKSLVSKKPNARIGIMWDDSLIPIYEEVIKSRKIKWTNTKIFSLVEYKDDLTVTFENTLFSEFVNKLNLERSNYESLKERINDLKTTNSLNDLYKMDDGIDLMIFPIDKRGNFLFNDFESKISYINYGNNGNEIVAPGIKSIMFAKKIVCFVIQDGSEDMVEIVNSRNIISNEFVSLLNIHNNITLFTLYSIIKKKNINKNGYVNDNENIADRVLSHSYEGDLSISNDDKKEIDPIDKFSVGLFKDNESPIDLEDEDDDSDDEDDNDEDEKIENMELSDIDEEIKDDEEIIDTEDDDGSAIDEPLNMDKTNLDDMIEKNIEEEVSQIDEDDENEDEISIDFEKEEFKNESDEQEETLYDIIKDEYESKINKDNENIDVEEFEEYRKLDDKFVEEEIETNIEDMEIESSLYKSDEQDEQIINKIKQMDELRDEEYYIPENYGDVDEEIKQLEIVKDQLEKELLELQENNSNREIPTPIELNDTFDINDNDAVSREADKYAAKQDVTIIYEDELDANYVNETIKPIDEKKSKPVSFTNHEINNNEFNDEIKIIDVNPNKKPETNIIDVPLNNKWNNEKKNNYVYVDGRNAEQIKRIIQIKKDALKTIELLLRNNELAIEQRKKELLLKQSKSDFKPIKKDNFNTNSSNNYVKISYVPGVRPVPLLMVNDTPENKVYEETVLEMIKKYKSNIGAKLFNESNKHLWNMGSYISYNELTNEIDLLAFSEFSNLIYLLRYVNKELFYYISKNNFKNFEKAMKGFELEFSIQK